MQAPYSPEHVNEPIKTSLLLCVRVRVRVCVCVCVRLPT